MHTKSELIIEDLDSKMGTKLDGVPLKGKSEPLKKEEHVFQLGHFNASFR